MRLYYNTNGFAHHRLEDAVDLLADLGYDGVALTPDVHHLDPLRASAAEVAKLARQLESRGLGVTVEGGARFILDPRRKHAPSLLSAEGHERRTDFYVRLLALARDLGSPLISIWSGKVEEGLPAAAAGLERLAERLAPVLEQAEALGVRVAFEPEPGMRVETLEDFAALRARLPRRAAGVLGLTIDTGHLAASEAPPHAEQIGRHAEHLLYVHLDDSPLGVHEHRFFGDGDVDFPALRLAFEQIGFAGPAAVELSRHSHDAAATAAAALRYLRGLGF